MPWKYGRSGHGPRCDCPDCNASFVQHNRDKHCDCMDCTYHREILAPAPSNGIPDRRYGAYFDSRDYAGPPKYEAPKKQTVRERVNEWRAQQQQRREAERMSTIHMCERKGCEAIIKGPAMGLVDIAANVDSERKGFELCPACVADVWGVLYEAPMPGTRERAYETPFDPERASQDATDAVETATAEQLAAALFQKLMKNAAIEGPKSSNE